MWVQDTGTYPTWGLGPPSLLCAWFPHFSRERPSLSSRQGTIFLKCAWQVAHRLVLRQHSRVTYCKVMRRFNSNRVLCSWSLPSGRSCIAYHVSNEEGDGCNKHRQDVFIMAHLRNGVGKHASEERVWVSTGRGGASIHPEKEWLPGARRSAAHVCLHRLPTGDTTSVPSSILS